MRIATYYPWVHLMGGIERTILETVKRSRHDWTVFTSHYRPEDTFPEFRDIDVRTAGLEVLDSLWDEVKNGG